MKMRRSRKWGGRAIEGLEPRRNPSLFPGAEAAWTAPVDFPIFNAPQLSTTPADGASFEVADAPSALTFHLGGPAFVLWSDNSIELRRVADDGTEAQAIPGDLGPAQLSDDSATIDLPASLPAGRYRIVVLGGSSLAFSYSQGQSDPMEDRTIAEFEVKPRAEVDLGVAGPVVRSVAGSLDDSKADASYQIHLPEGVALWRLALQVDAGRIGSGLIAGLYVYDSAGREVASTAVGSVLQGDHPNDPYLFTALAPGDYLVVVSKPAAQTGGDFRLNVAADPVKGPTRVTSFTPTRSGSGANGFTIGFDSAIDPSRLRSDSVYAVDAAGSTFAVRLVSVGSGLSAARFEFLSPLPAGNYRLMIGSDKPLADLLGRTPIADTLPIGALAAWTVTANEAGTARRVAPPQAVIAAGTLDLKPGAAIDVPVVLGSGGSLVLNANLRSGSMRIEVIGAKDGRLVMSREVDSPLAEVLIRPGAGAFVVRIVSSGKSQLAGSWRLSPASMSDESLVTSAVGTAGMIGLRMSEGTSEAPPEPAVPMPHGPQQPTAGPGELGPSPWASGSNSTPIGRPTATADAVPAVGPMTADGLTSVAWAQGGDSSEDASLILSVGGRADDGHRRGPARVAKSAARTRIADADVTHPGSVDGEIARAGTAPDDAADLGALDRAERVAEAVKSGFRWIVGRPPGDAVNVEVADEGSIARADAAIPGTDGSDGKVQRSALELPFTVLFVTASTYHLRRATRRWWGRRKLAADVVRAAGQSPSPNPLFRGPRRMSAAAEAFRPTAPRRG